MTKTGILYHAHVLLSSLLLTGFVTLLTAMQIVLADSSAITVNTQDLPPLTLNNLQGQQRSLDEWRNKVIILNFWATWCGPCQIEIPHLIEYQSTYGMKGLQVVGVGLDEARKLKNFVRTLGINYPILRAAPDQHSYLLRAWGNSMGVLPFTVVIDRSGQLVFSQSGIFSDEAFKTYVKPLIKDDQVFSTPVDDAP